MYLAGPDSWMRHCSKKDKKKLSHFVICEDMNNMSTGQEMGLKWLQYKDGMWESLSCEEVQMRIQKAVRKILHSTGLSVVL